MSLRAASLENTIAVGRTQLKRPFNPKDIDSDQKSDGRLEAGCAILAPINFGKSIAESGGKYGRQVQFSGRLTF